MSETRATHGGASEIRRVAVLGAGTMGAAIAAHAANAGLDVDLLDIAPTELTDEERERGLALDHPDVRDRIVRAGFGRMTTARPAALASPALAQRIRLGNFEDDFDRIAAADWIVEAIIERLEPKQEVMARVEKTARPGAVISSNTSGIPLASIAEGRSGEFRRRFLGTHFFNPPRYLKLVELIPLADTDPAVLERVRAFVEDVLGKGPVVAKDTPNFIANRLGSFAGMYDPRYAFEHGYSIEEVDALTGPLLGRPRTATFRLMDQVGLDVAVGVARNLYDLVPDDESREDLRVPAQLDRMLGAGRLGIKSGAGFYKRDRRDGETVFDVVDVDTLDYRPSRRPDLPIVPAARQERDLGARLRLFLDRAEEDRGARYVRDTLLPSLGYAARRVPEIADSLVEVDHAMEWGFGHEAGPFRTWDLIGVARVAEAMDRLGIEVAGWIRDFLAAGNQRLYRDGTVYSPVTGDYEPVPSDAEVLDLDRRKAEVGEVARNDSASLVDLGDRVLCLEIHSPASALDAGVMEAGHRALDELRTGRWRGMVIANQAHNFCVGANLGEVGMTAYQGAYDQVREVSRALQTLLQSFRYAPWPVVVAPHGQTLGGGAEVCMHADRVVASLETYIGLVEVGVGLVPAGGGCKELVRRVVSPAMRVGNDAPPLPFLQRVLQTIGTAKVATSAVEARELGFFGDDDRVVMHPDHLLNAAKQEVLAMADGYRPPVRDRSIYAAGLPTLAALEMGVRTLHWSGLASEHDTLIGTKLARVLCGGELSAPQWVDEDHIMELEREAFVELLHEPKTMERIQHLLTTGKPLRN
ncbi:MAG TPA: 3-hydroxyacyl-CoA dehydrogenase/enoyl-CoA hydratase family protein [Actinomycetes bacterium]|nr:3-hydroxyacyl-CoA dehydrogenase/enoyl-CoA hydratase family protein [Actinomycetes bacterium]